MDEIILDPIEEKNKKRGKTTSYVLHGLFLILLFIPFFTFPDPPPGMQGVLVNLGMPDQGEGTDNAPPPKASSTATKPKTAPPPPPPPPKSEPKPNKPTPTKPKPEPVKEEPAQKEVVTDDNSKEIAILREKERKKKEEERRKQEQADKQQQEEDRQKRIEEEQERREEEAQERKERAEELARQKEAAEKARRKAEAEAKAKAEADARAKAEADARAEAAGLFGGSGKGKGNTGTSGNQGDPNGDPNSDILEGISTGSGKIGGGLGSRGVLSAPDVSDNTQKSGRVVVRVCVDSSGKVISADFTQKGSTTSDSQLRATAIRNAKKYKFAKGSIDKQCGTITYDFKLR